MPDTDADRDRPATRVRGALDDFLDRLARIVAAELKPTTSPTSSPGPVTRPTTGPTEGGRS